MQKREDCRPLFSLWSPTQPMHCNYTILKNKVALLMLLVYIVGKHKMVIDGAMVHGMELMATFNMIHT